ncbi:S9 family peptidase [Aliikangiella coralliicola]|uniref:S9 family peptidase n=1 Tax=Aliikangiella coralliicola TaxID=2592383 RepID=A0A545TWH6_9GAMM|nr:prolyl oligopeptidase family serine peptidase [Aliikangiella coralliicola]TQV81562.1 S9 family peptidase [Aliikangiella coralliicola]
MKLTKPYGSWKSDLTADVLAHKGKRFGHMTLDNGSLYWLEVRASEKGRGVLMRSSSDNLCEEVLPSEISVRTKVHEYGGGDFLVADGKVYFSNAEDNRVYLFSDGKLAAITRKNEAYEERYADFFLDSQQKYLLAVRESHKESGVVNELVNIVIESGEIQVLHSGFDFYSFPRLSPQGHRLCWTCWNQPDMPWDSAELWLADFHPEAGTIDASHRVTGGGTDSVFQPSWSSEGILHYICDKSGWLNIYNHSDGVLNALTPIDRDFGVPQWIFGLGTYVITSDNSLYALSFEAGQQQLCHIEPDSGHIEPVALPFKHFEGQLLGDDKSLYFCAAGPAMEVAMYRYDIQQKKYFALTEISPFPLPADDISIAEAISFESFNNRQCHAFYYPPASSRFQGPEETCPPLIVMSHGGPTSFSDNSLSPAIQFWTNRGFAVVDVNYGGSTGYGKKYREFLTGNWGVVDVEDCVAAANHLVEKKLADKNGLLIRGGSAGGYTTLCALTFFDVFTAGMSRYGVSDLESLASDSHKFEARYLDKLVGPYPQEKARYQERSPIHQTDKLSCPILLLQGADDKVVPPNQAELMVEALEKKKIPYSYILFEGEGHGFRQAETIIQAFNAELDFYRKILGIQSEEKISEVEIHNFVSS